MDSEYVNITTKHIMELFAEFLVTYIDAEGSGNHRNRRQTSPNGNEMAQIFNQIAQSEVNTYNNITYIKYWGNKFVFGGVVHELKTP